MTDHVNLDAWRRLCSDIAAGAARREQDGVLPYEQVRQVADIGFGASRLDGDLGGNDSVATLFERVMELAAADANVAHVFRNHFFVLELLRDARSAVANDKWYRQVVDGAVIAAATTDAKRPTDSSGRALPGGSGARLTRESGQLVLSGHKQYATGSLYADLLAVTAADPNGDAVLLVLPADRPGVIVTDDWEGFGQRFTGSGTVQFANVAIDPEDIVSTSPSGTAAQRYRSSFAQLYLTAVVAGIVRRTVDDATELMKTKRQNLYFAPSPVRADDPVLQVRLGELSTYAFGAEASVLRAAAELDRAADSGTDAAWEVASLAAAHAKVQIDKTGARSADELFELGGASATHRAAQLDRHWRNARTLASHNPADYKARAIGAWLARGERLPDRGFF